MKKTVTIVFLMVTFLLLAFNISASAQVEARAIHNINIKDDGWGKVIPRGTLVTIFVFKHKKDVYTYGIYSDDYAGIIDSNNNPFDIEIKKLKKLSDPEGKKATKSFMYYRDMAYEKASKNALSGKYKTTATFDLWSDFDCLGDIKENDPITIIGYKKKTDLLGTTYYYAIVNDKAAGVFQTLYGKPLDLNIPLIYLPSTDDGQVEYFIDNWKKRIVSRRQEEKLRARELEAARQRRQDSIMTAKIKDLRYDDSLVAVRLKQKYMRKTWYYTDRDGEYQRFEPIEVVDIKFYRDPTYGNLSFPIKLRYKGTDRYDTYDAVIFSDGECTFESAFHDIPPAKEYPTVRHWTTVKNYELVLGMNKDEV